MNKVVVAITGASGSIYAKVLLDQLLEIKHQFSELGIVMSNNAKAVWEYELGNTDYLNYPFTFYDKSDFSAPFASGSAKYNVMFIAPCSMGTLARIAHGVSDDLVTRAADVMLKERGKLILLARETPLSKIHLQNMLTITEAGGIICPAIPSFYSKPNNFFELVSTVTHRALHLASFNYDSYSWGSKN